MNKRRIQQFSLLLAGVVVVAMAGPLRADGPTAQQEMVSQIKALRARLEQLEAQQKHDEVYQKAQQAEVDRVVQDVLNDTNSRNMLVDAGGFTAGYNAKGKFVIQSEDGDFTFHPWLQLQIRYEGNWREHGNANGSDDFESGFEIRAAKFGFDGNMFGPNLTYYFDWATNRESLYASAKDATTGGSAKDAAGNNINYSTNVGGLPALEEAWVKYNFKGTPFYIKAGQLKDPLNHEQIMSSKYQLVTERSLAVDNWLGGNDYLQGASLIYYDKDQPVRAELAYTDGTKSNNSGFQNYNVQNAASGTVLPGTGDSPPASPNNFGVATRIEYKVTGDWPDYDHFTSLGDKHALLVFGVGADLTQARANNTLIHVTDVQFNLPGGLNAYAAYMGRWISQGPVVGTGSYYSYDPDAVVQVGYLINDHWEPYLRYEYLYFDHNNLTLATVSGSTTTATHEIVAGMNYYFYGQAAKLTGDIGYLPRGSNVVSDDGGATLSNAQAELFFRLQLQFLL